MEISGPFLQFKNINLQVALELRKQGRLKEARGYLDKACDEEDGDALFFKAHMLMVGVGGWGVTKNFLDCESLALRSADAGSVYGMLLAYYLTSLSEQSISLRAKAIATKHIVVRLFFEPTACDLFWQALQEGIWLAYLFSDLMRHPSFIEHIKQIANLGEATACGILSDDPFFLQKGAILRNSTCMEKLAKQCFEANDIASGAYWYTKLSYGSWIFQRLKSPFEDESLRLRELYVYGRKFAKGWFPSCGLKQESLEVYCDSRTAAQRATVAFLLCCKRWGIYKDVARLIGQMIWKSRNDPAIWNVKLNIFEPENKKLKN